MSDLSSSGDLQSLIVTPEASLLTPPSTPGTPPSTPSTPNSKPVTPRSTPTPIDGAVASAEVTPDRQIIKNVELPPPPAKRRRKRIILDSPEI